MLRSAEQDAARLEREKLDYATGAAALVRAAIAANRGDDDRAVSQLKRAEDSFDLADMAVFAAVSRLRRAHLIGGDEGTELLGKVDQLMAEQSVVNPEAIAAMYAPGFGD